MGAVLAGLAGFAAADGFVSANNSILTGVQDTSNQWGGGIGAGTFFEANFTNNNSTPFYLNSIIMTGTDPSNNSVNPAGFFDQTSYSAIANDTLGGAAPTLANPNANYYQLGTAMAAGQSFNWYNIFAHSGAYASSLATGVYNFDAQFMGGADSSAQTVVGTLDLQLEIVNKIDVTETSNINKSVIGPGDVATVTATLQNNMSRDFVTTTWFYGWSGTIPNGSFAGNWGDQTIAAGSSRTDLHSTWTNTYNDGTTVPDGTYSWTTGVVGGLHNGDSFYFGDSNNTTLRVTSVPEPFTMALGLGGLALAFVRRRRAAK